MLVNRLILKNWRNFRTVDVELGLRVFVAGPNASGKSNLLDVFAFLKDVAKPGQRGGISKLRCLAARKYPDVEIEVHLADNGLIQPESALSTRILQSGAPHQIESCNASENVSESKNLSR